MAQGIERIFGRLFFRGSVVRSLPAREPAGLLLDGLLLLFLRFHALIKDVVRPSQERDVVKRGLPGLGQQCPLLLKRDPGANLRSEIVRLVIGVLWSNGSG